MVNSGLNDVTQGLVELLQDVEFCIGMYVYRYKNEHIELILSGKIVTKTALTPLAHGENGKEKGETLITENGYLPIEVYLDI